MTITIPRGLTSLGYRDALKFRSVVITIDKDKATLACVHPLTDDQLAELKTTLRRQTIDQEPIDQADFLQLLERTYPPNESDAQDRRLLDELKEIIDEAYQSHVTDIHFEYRLDGTGRVRMRRDGRIKKRLTRLITAEKLKAFVNLIQFESQAKRDEKHPGSNWLLQLPSGRTTDMRVQFLHAIRGLEASLRLTGTDARLFRLHELKMPKGVFGALTLILRSLRGAIIVVGPVSSGKSTVQRAISLYIEDLFEALSNGEDEARVVSVERPVELQQDFTQVSLIDGAPEQLGQMTSKTVRADYDLLNLGEINAENIKEFFEQALAGKLTVGSFHALDDIAALFRILDMGIKVSTIDNGLRAILYVRTAQKLCPTCRVEAPLEISAKAFLQRIYNQSTPDIVYAPGDDKDCPDCKGYGSVGFHPFFQLLPITHEITDALREGGQHLDVYHAAKENRYEMAMDVLTALTQGHISQESAITLLSSG